MAHFEHYVVQGRKHGNLLIVGSNSSDAMSNILALCQIKGSLFNDAIW